MALQDESTTTTDPSHIPPFAKPLAPYIKSRQEALRIRQALTFHLRSQIVFADNDPDHPNCHARSHLSLCVPNEAVVDVQRIPSEFTGLRREYLQALEAHVAARKQYQSISEATASSKFSPEPLATEVSGQDSSLELQAYLRLVRDRRRHAKLQVFQHYIQELRQRDIVKPESFGNQEGHHPQFLLQEESEGNLQSGCKEDGDVEELLHNLERAVVRAKSQLEKEKKLLGELKAQNEGGGDSRLGDNSLGVKLSALQRTRDELVQWVEEKLVSGASNDEDPAQELPPEEIEESSRILEEQKARIMERYGKYVDARRSLLDTASRACQPITPASTKPTGRSQDISKATVEEPLSIEPLKVLSFASNILYPLSKSQRSLALQKFYLSAMIAKEKSTTLRILDRLSDESHLLPEYPILARQPRFKHAAAALRSRHAAGSTEPANQDEVVNLAEAWAFASKAAESGEKEYVEKKVAEGSDKSREAEMILQNIYRMLNQDLEETMQDDQEEKQDVGDIWALEAQSTRPRAKMNGIERRSKGPWTPLSGRVGLTD